MVDEDESQTKQRFGHRLREIRKGKGISQEALALSCGLDRTYIGGVERGERNISLVNIHRIARAIGVPADQLFKADENG
jgi:transcriptional regulator with XRE-family HTH domain